MELIEDLSLSPALIAELEHSKIIPYLDVQWPLITVKSNFSFEFLRTNSYDLIDVEKHCPDIMNVCGLDREITLYKGCIYCAYDARDKWILPTLVVVKKRHPVVQISFVKVPCYLEIPSWFFSIK